MEPIFKQSHLSIQDGLQRGIDTVENKILKPFGLTNTYTSSQLINLISNDLTNMNFEIKYASSLIDPDLKQSVPAYIQLNDFDRERGGIIKLNKKYPPKALTEALYHEYAHIKDETLPIHISNLNAPNSRSTFVTPYLRMVENQADMIAYALMMPPEQMRADLIRSAYDINFILNKYNHLETSSVLHWITLINPLPCHFAWIIIEKDPCEKQIRVVIHDCCSYDHQNNPRPFSIESVLNNPDSAVAEAFRERRNAKKESSIQGTDFLCYAYYEPDLSMEVIKDYIPCSNTVNYDRLLVIGWTKQINDIIQMVTQVNKQ